MIAAPVGWSLRQPQEIINKGVDVRQDLGVGIEGEGVTGQGGQGMIQHGGRSAKNFSCPVIKNCWPQGGVNTKGLG